MGLAIAVTSIEKVISHVMPELPEVETVRRGVAPAITGARLAEVLLRRPDLRYPFPPGFVSRLEGGAVTAVDRRAKYLLIRLDTGWTLVWHLGMSGRVLVHPHGSNAPPGAHDHVIFRFDNGVSLVFNDTRRFGMMDIASTGQESASRHLARLGPEPLDPSFTGAVLARSLSGRRGSIKACLLDQSIVAGLGNIYVCEALYHARLSPLREAGSIGPRRAARLVSAIRMVLEAAIEAGGSSLRDYVRTSGELGYFQHGFAVYDRVGRPCPECACDPSVSGGVQRVVQSGRSTFWCPALQR